MEQNNREEKDDKLTTSVEGNQDKDGMASSDNQSNNANQSNSDNLVDFYSQLPTSANSVTTAPIKKPKPYKQILIGVVAVFTAAFMFLIGFLVRFATTDVETRKFDWAMSMIEKYYIGDIIDGVQYSREDYLTHGFSLLDPYSAYLTPEEVSRNQNSMQGKEEGFGFGLDNTKDLDGDGVLDIEVISVEFKSPSENKLYVGDLVYKLNGHVSDATDIGGSVNPYVQLGNNTFEIKRPVYNEQTDSIAYQPVSVIVAYEEFEPEYIKYYDSDTESASMGLDDETVYLKFTQFNAPADTQIAEYMERFYAKGKSNLILDMRSNPGGYVNIAQLFGKYFVDSPDGQAPLLATAKYKDGSVQNIVSTGYEYSKYNFDKIVVLINENSASCSEMLLGAMLDTGTVDLVIGKKSYGKGIMQITDISRQYGCGIRLTAATWYTPLGSAIHHQGFNPTEGYEIQSNPKNFPYSFNNDSELQKAIEFIAA